MAEPTLTQIFGSGAVQDTNSLTIQKSALASMGLTVSASNSAESLLVALVKTWQSFLTTANQEANPEQQITIADSYQSITQRNNTQYRQFSKTINLEIVDTTNEIDPDAF